MLKTVSNGQSIHPYVSRGLQREFYKNPNLINSSGNGLDPYGFSTSGLVLYLPLWALKDSAFKSVDATGYSCTVTEATWHPLGRVLDGTNDIITVGNIGNVKTLEFWMKPASTTESILEEVDNTGPTIDTGSMVYGSWDECFVDGVNTDTVTAAWHNVMLTSTANVDMSAFRLGLVDATFFEGYFGEVRAYTDEKVVADALRNYNCTVWRYQ